MCPEAATKPSEFALKEYEKLRDEIKGRIDEIGKIEIGSLAAALAVSGWLLEDPKRPSDWMFFWIPLVIWVLGGCMVLSKSRHLNRLSTYIHLHIENQAG